MKRIRMNLATLDYDDRRAFYPVLTAAVFLVLGMLIFNIHLYSRYRADIQGYEQKISLLEKSKPRQTSAANQPAKKDMESLKSQVGLVNRLIAMDIFPWDRLLDELETCTPPDMVLLRFAPTKDTDRIRIEGKAPSVKEITEFLQKLDQSTFYKNSVLLNVSTLRATGETGPSSDSSIRFEIETVAALDPNSLRKDPVK